MSLVEALKNTNKFQPDVVTFSNGKNSEWVHDQLKLLSETRSSFEKINQTSIGNLLFIHDYASPNDKKVIESFLSSYLLHYYNSL